MLHRRSVPGVFRNVLVAADFSASSTAAFQLARVLARPGAPRFTVLHVVEPQPPSERLGPGAELVGQNLRAVYRSDAPAPVDYLLRDGSPGTTIVRTAEELGCDAIVLGTHGRTGVERLLAGSVAETVLRATRCAVLAAKVPRARSMPDSPRVILHPTDFSEHSEPALELACALAEQYAAELVVLHVAPDENTARRMIDVSQCALMYPDEWKELRDRLVKHDCQCAVETVVRAGDPAAETVGTAEERRCDLIVMGTHSRSGVGRLLMGSVAEAVLRSARCPVLIARAPLPAAGESAAERQRTSGAVSQSAH